MGNSKIINKIKKNRHTTVLFQLQGGNMDLFDTDTTFERQLFFKAAKNQIPLYGVLELLPICNLNCDMCYVRLSKQEMEEQGRLRSVEEWISLAEQMKEAGTLFLLLTGGEPLLFPGFRELYTRLKEMGMILTINTNGTLINEEWASFFAKNKPRRINITLYGSKNETYETLCHKKDGFDRTIQGIKLLKNYDIDVKINGSLVKKNFDDRMEIIEIGEKYDIPVRIDTYMYPASRERKLPFNFQERLEPQEAARARVEILKKEMGEEIFRQYREQTLALVENAEEGENKSGHMTCRAGQTSFVVNWKGMLRSCIVMDHPSYPVFESEENFTTLWNKVVQETKQIKTSSECNQCRIRSACNTCAAAAIAECGDSMGVVRYLCEYTKETIKQLRMC